MTDQKQKNTGFVDNLRQIYALPKKNIDFSFFRCLPVAFAWGLAYGFVSYWLSKFLDGTEGSSIAIGFVGAIAGTISTIVFDRWKMGWALDELLQPTFNFFVFLTAWYFLK